MLGLMSWTSTLVILSVGKPTWTVIASLGCNGKCVCCFLVSGQVFVNNRAHGDIRASAQALLAFMNALGLLIGNLLVGCVRPRRSPLLRRRDVKVRHPALGWICRSHHTSSASPPEILGATYSPPCLPPHDNASFSTDTVRLS